MRTVKLIALSFAGLVAIALIVAAVLILRFDPNDYKPRVTSLVEERTGRTIEIADDIEWTLFPWLAIETGGVTIGNQPGFGTAPFATIESVSARVRVWPLFRRQVELGQITIDGFALDVGTNADGVASWSDLLGPDTPNAPETPAAAEPAAGGIAGLEIAGVTLRNGRVLWRDRGEVRYVISDAELTTGTIALGEPVSLTAGLSVLDVPTQRSVTLHTTTTAALEGGDVTLDDLEIEVTAADPGGAERGRATLETESLRITGGSRVTAAAGSITGTARNLPVGAEALDGEVRWPAFEVDLDAGSARIDGLTTSVNGVTATWRIEAEDLAGSPRVAGTLDLSPAPAAQLLALLGIEAPAGIEPATLGSIAGHGDLEAAADGTVTLDGFTLELLGLAIRVDGSVDADSRIAATIDIPEFAPTAALRSLAADRVPIELDGTNAISAGANLAMALDGTGPISIDGLALAVDGVRLTADLSVAGDSERRVTGTASLAAPDPAVLRRLAGDMFPTNLDAAAIGPSTLDVRLDFVDGTDTLTLESIGLRAFGLAAGGRMTVNNVRSAPVVRGSGTLARFDPGAVLTRLGQPTPQTSDPAAFKTAEFRGDFVVDAAQADFRNMTVTIDGTPITGSLSVENFDAPSYRFELATDTLDVDRYLPPPADEAADGERTAGDIELASEPLERLELVGSARVGALRLAGLDFQDVAATLTIGGGRARIEPAHAALYGGEFDGGLAVDTTGDTPSMRLNGKATNLALDPLVTALTGESNVSGTGNFDLDLTGAGTTVTDALTTAAGTMSFALTSGSIDGFNLGRTLCAAYNLRAQLPQPASAPRRTDYTVIRAAADVSDGIATSRELTAQTSFMTVTGSGRMNLPDARVDYDMSAELTASVPISGCESMIDGISGSIPFTIEGPLADPDIEPDYAEIIRNRVRDNVEDSLRNRLQDRLRNLR